MNEKEMASSGIGSAVAEGIKIDKEILKDLNEVVESLALPKDPWEHRSVSMRCSTCMWSVMKSPEGNVKLKRELGRCRKHAPTMNGYPAVFEDDWCGDHKLDENKI